MNIFLIRHGLTVPGEEGRYQGFLDESLSEKGKALLVRAPQNPSHVYVSPAKRAKETAALLFPEAELVCISDLLEMNFGVFEGRSWRDMSDDPQYRRWVDGMCLDTCPGGESRASFSRRVCRAFLKVFEEEKEWQRRHGEETDLFIVSHGGTQMAILERWGAPPRDFYSWQTPCGSGWLLKRTECPPPPASSGCADSSQVLRTFDEYGRQSPSGVQVPRRALGPAAQNQVECTRHPTRSGCADSSQVLRTFDEYGRQKSSGTQAFRRDPWLIAGTETDAASEAAPENFLLQAVKIISFTRNA